jgi:phage tail-like protein
MSQRADRRTLTLQLVPLAVLDPPPTGETLLATWGALADPTTPTVPSLCLCPGEVSELLVRLDHRGDPPLAYRLHITGDMPHHWFSFYTEGSELRRGHPAEAVVRFRPDADFFENQQALSPEAMMTLSYRGEVRVYEVPLEDGDPPGEAVPAATHSSGTLPTGLLLASEPFCLLLRPRSLYPQFLPAVYREVDFIGRFLKIFEQSFEPAVQTLQSLWAYLDPLTAPEALLPFLAQWVGWHNESQWTVEQQRSLIRRAMDIYRWRGTRRGLQLYLHFYTGLPLSDRTRPAHQQPIQIIEALQHGFVLGTTALGSTAILGGGKPFHFIVRLCPPAGHALDAALIRSIIEQEKPVFCTYDLDITPIDPAVAIAPREEPAHV